jgi:hypothetical protein
MKKSKTDKDITVGELVQNIDITVGELVQNIDSLRITSRQKEFIKAAIRALLQVALEKRFGCKVSI